MRKKFEIIFRGAIKEWPEEVDLSILQNQRKEGHEVSGLWKIVEEIENSHIGTKEEVIFRELHWSIYIFIHSIALNLLHLKTSNIRPEAVEKIFERRLQAAIDSRDSSWRTEDFSLANEYFQDSVTH